MPVLVICLAFFLLACAVILDAAVGPAPKNWAAVGLAVGSMLVIVLGAVFGAGR